MEVTLGIYIGRYTVSLMRGIDWTKSFLALILGYNTKDGFVTGYMKLYISMKHLLKLVIAALVVGACVLVPVLAPALSQFVKILLSGAKVVTKVLPVILSVMKYAV